MIVVKVGGAVATDAAREILSLARSERVVVVHGAGPQISSEMRRRGLPVRFVRGRRVTSPQALEVVRESLLDVNRRLCEAIGPAAVGLAGDEIGLLALRARGLGLVGDPIPSAPQPILEVLDAGLIPVVAPLAEGPLNVNADEAAAALAVGLGARRLLFVTDVPGVLHGDGVLGEIEADEADRLLPLLEGGIVPKLQAAVQAARSGVPAHIGETAVV